MSRRIHALLIATSSSQEPAMRPFSQVCSVKTVCLALLLTYVTVFPPLSNAMDISQASEQVKTMSCKDNLTVDQVLDKSIKSHSQRDIGWRAFQETDYVDIERAVLINKAMERRYRWRVFKNGSIEPQTDRAENLCSAESD
jgi:hypothetical protein